MEENELKSSLVVSKKIRKRPQVKNRDSTDQIYVIVLLIVFVIWLGLVTYGYFYGFEWGNFNKTRYVSAYASFIKAFFDSGYFLVSVILVSSVIATVFFFLILKNVPKFCSYVTLVFISIETLLLIICIEYGTNYMSREDIRFFIGYLFIFVGGMIMKIIYNVIILASTVKVGVSVVTEIIEKTLTSFCVSIRALSVAVLICLLYIFIAFSTVATLCSSIFFTYKVIVSFGGLYLCSFFLCFGRMVISPIIDDAYCAENRSDSRKTSSFRNFLHITRYHLGYAAIAAIPFLPPFAAFITVLKHKISSTQDPLDKISFCFLSLWLIWNNAEYSMIVTSIYGTNFFQSTKFTIRLLTKNCPLSLAYHQIFLSIWITLISALAILITTISCIWIMIQGYEDYDHSWLVLGATITVAMLLMPIFEFLGTASRVNLLCSLEDIEDREPLQKITQQVTLDETI